MGTFEKNLTATFPPYRLVRIESGDWRFPTNPIDSVGGTQGVMSEVMVCILFLILKLSLGPWQSLLTYLTPSFSTCKVEKMSLLPTSKEGPVWGEVETINSSVLSIFYLLLYSNYINCCYLALANVWDVYVADSYLQICNRSTCHIQIRVFYLPLTLDRDSLNWL